MLVSADNTHRFTMHVCICALCTGVCIHVCMHAYIDVHQMCVDVHMSVCICVGVHVYACMWGAHVPVYNMRVHICVLIYMHVSSYVDVDLHACASDYEGR